MKTRTRDDAIARNKATLHILTLACLAESVAIVVLAGLCIYAFFSKEIVYQPTMGQTYTLSQRHVTPMYLRQSATDILQLRLTWNPNTIVKRYQNLVRMTTPGTQRDIRQSLTAEIKTVKKRNITSVFYQHTVLVDVKSRIVKVKGQLQRIDDGVLLPTVPRTYDIQFHYWLGTLQIVSITQEDAHHD